jgi:hypothetical protein
MKTVRVACWIWLACSLAACSGDKKLELGGTCTLNSDCTQPLLCKLGSCRKACMRSIDCDNGGRCVTVDGVAVCQTQAESACGADQTCATGLVCRTVDNTCRTRCSPTNDTSCVAGQTCNGTVCLENKELTSSGNDAAVGADDAATSPDAGAAGPDLPLTPPDAAAPDVPLATSDAASADVPLAKPDAAATDAPADSGLAADTSGGADSGGAPSFCGDGRMTGSEECDATDFGTATCSSKGFVKGTLRCTNDCRLDLSGCSHCGDGKVDPGESCDGANLGSSNCMALGYDSGVIACNADCSYNVTGCKSDFCVGALSASGWCFATVPGFHLYGISSYAPDKFFAVGELGAVVHFDGSQWSIFRITEKKLTSVWAAGAAEAFAVGEDGELWHFNGSAWSQQSSGVTVLLRKIWGGSANDILAVGDGGTIIRYDGTVWKKMDSQVAEDILSVWGYFAVGKKGTVLHWNGTQWERQTSNTVYDLNGIWGPSSTDVYAVGVNGTILHYDGVGWTKQTSNTGKTLVDVGGGTGTLVHAMTGDGDVLWVNGTTWSSFTECTGCGQSAITALNGTTLAIVGDYGAILLGNKDTWTNAQEYKSFSYNDVWASGRKNVYVCGSAGSTGLLRHFDGAAWASVENNCIAYGGYSATIDRIVGVGSELWVNCFSTIYFDHNHTPGAYLFQYDGLTWQTCGGGSHNSAFAVTSPNDLDALNVWFDYGNWVTRVEPNVHCTACGTCSAVALPGTTGQLNDIWHTGAGDKFIVGNAGVIYYFDGSEWTLAKPVTTENLLAVWGSGSTNVFAVGDNGTILKFDGTNWTPQDSGTKKKLLRMGGVSATDMRAVGEGGIVLRYDGASWKAETTLYPSTWSLTSIYGARGTGYFATGARGTILYKMMK